MTYFISNNWRKAQYDTLNNIPVRKAPSICHSYSLLAISLCLLLLYLSIWNFHYYQVPNAYVLYFNAKQPLLHVTSKNFLSFGLDSSLLRDMANFPIDNERFITLAQHLSPAYVRIGGTSADCLFFNQTSWIMSQQKVITEEGQDISNFTITNADFKAIYDFTKKSQLQMIFDVNVLIRNKDGSWNDTNALQILLFAKSHNMDLDWQLGNEPNSFKHVFNVTITPIQLAKDYLHLRHLLDQVGYDGSLLVGPEVNHVGDLNQIGELYAKAFVEYTSNNVDYITWHQYYLNGREANVKDFVNPATFNYLPIQIKSFLNIINSTGSNISTWLSETSTAYGGGAPELSDRFVAGFLWLDKLGYSASAGLNVVTRQSFYGGNYAMVGPDLVPNPDWWVSVIYKQFVSEKVLQLKSSNSSGYARFYAHCTPEKALINRVPAITVYGVNIQEDPVKITFEGLFSTFSRHMKIFSYSLTAEYLESRDIKLNGKILRLKSNGKLPPFHPIILETARTLILPAYSMTFMVMHGATVPACLEERV